VEPIYQSRYKTEPLGNVEPKSCAVSLPERNFFIPDDLTVLPLGTQQHPRKIYQSDFVEAFFKEDHEFSLPKAELSIRLYFAG
jgi:secreted Zn-dependent insulinase-like peptidase